MELTIGDGVLYRKDGILYKGVIKSIQDNKIEIDNNTIELVVVAVSKNTIGENMKLKGILTNCSTDEEKEVEIEYEITERNGERVFSLLNGVTGFESFYIDHFTTDIKGMKNFGWTACAGTKDRYDKLFIPPEEMRKALP
jgi:hypothetical protein